MKNWKKALGKSGKFSSHGRSNVHKDAWIMWTQAKSQPCSIASSLDSLFRQQVEKKQEISHVPYTSPTFQNELIDIIGKKCTFKDY